MRHWHLPGIDAPRGKRDAVVVYEDDGARAVVVALQPLEELGEHQVRESAWGPVRGTRSQPGRGHAS